jgi:hypothetical protein
MILAHNLERKNQDIIKNNHSTKALNRAVNMVAQFCTIEDLDAFKMSFTAYVHNHIKNDSILKHLDAHKLFDFTALSQLEQTYRSYKVDIENNNYDYIATNKTQIEAYHFAVKICKLLNENKSLLSHTFVNIPLIRNGFEFLPNYEAITQLI